MFLFLILLSILFQSPVSLCKSDRSSGHVLSSVIVMVLNSGKNMHQINFFCVHQPGAIKAKYKALTISESKFMKIANNVNFEN